VSAELFGAALVELEAELDWTALGELYCHAGGASFFPPEQVRAIREAGLLFAGDVGNALATLPPGGPGRSLYVGAAVAELIPALSEALVLEREVVLQNLPGPEPDELNRALHAVGERLGRRLPAITTGDVTDVARGGFDHVWMTSVLTDPDAFPALHDHLYRRSGELATGRGRVRGERGRATALLAALTRRLANPALWTTTDEEQGFVREALAALELELTAPPSARLSAIVGDPVRTCLVEAPPEAPA
jgi:hypothetical protein